MTPLVLSLLAVADPVLAGPQPAPPPEVISAQGEASKGWLAGAALREFRAGVGASAASGTVGVSPTAQFGVEVDPWERLGFRLTLGTVLGAGSGEWSAVELSPGVVFRAFAPGAPVTPYLAVGGQLSFLTIDPGSRSNYRAAALHSDGSGAGKLSSALSAPGADSGGVAGSSGAMARISAAPEATVGAALRLTRDVALDVGVRYVLLTWQGKAHSGLTATVLVCAPLSF